METLKDKLIDFWNEYPAIAIAGILIGAIILVVLAFFAVVSFIGAIVGLFALGLAAIFWAPIVAGSIFIALLLKAAITPLKALLGIWLSGPQLDQFYTFVTETDYLTLVFVIALLTFAVYLGVKLLQSIIGSFQPFHQTIVNGQIDDD